MPTPSRKISYYAIHGGAAVSDGELPGTGFGVRLGAALQRGLYPVVVDVDNDDGICEPEG